MKKKWTDTSFLKRGKTGVLTTDKKHERRGGNSVSGSSLKRHYLRFGARASLVEGVLLPVALILCMIYVDVPLPYIVISGVLLVFYLIKAVPEYYRRMKVGVYSLFFDLKEKKLYCVRFFSKKRQEVNIKNIVYYVRKKEVIISTTEGETIEVFLQEWKSDDVKDKNRFKDWYFHELTMMGHFVDIIGRDNVKNYNNLKKKIEKLLKKDLIKMDEAALYFPQLM